MRNRKPVLRRIKYLTKEQLEGVVQQATNARDRLVLVLMYGYALRRGEVCLLRREDIDFAAGEITIRRLKNGETRTYPLDAATSELLRTFIDARHDDNPYLFPSRQRNSQPISGSTIYGLYRRCARAAGLPKPLQHPHAFRHSSATHQLAAGAELVDVQDWLAHESIVSTTRYARVTNKRRKAHHARLLASEEMAKL